MKKEGQRQGALLPQIGIADSIASKPHGTVTTQDEFLHKPAPSGSYTATETSYFGFSIPEQRLNAEIYIWFHPVLKMMSGSIYIWRGMKTSTLSCEYVNDYRYLPFPEADIGDYQIREMGLKVKVLEPLKSIRIELADPEQDVSFDIQFDAIMPPGVRPGSFHFTQAMKTTGTLNLRGERFPVNSFFSRDRSWGQERSEKGLKIPPFSWSVGVLDETFAFHAMGFDSPELNPVWKGRYPIEPGSNLSWGYIYRDGKTFPVTAMRQHTEYEADGLSPRTIELHLTDSGGEALELWGFVTARMPWQAWQQISAWMCQVRWETNRGTAWGELQEMQYSDFIRHFGRS